MRPIAADLRNGTISAEAMSVQSGGMGESRGLCINAIPHVLAFHAQQDPVSGEVNPALSGGSGQSTTAIVAWKECQSGAVTSSVFGTITAARSRAGIEGIVGPLLAGGSGGLGHRAGADEAASGHILPVAFAENSRAEVRLEGGDGQTTGALKTGGGKPGQSYPAVDDRRLAVRRLTPTECERLQGFGDGWTDIPGASDSARYRAIGNSKAVPVVRWVGERIAAWDRAHPEDRLQYKGLW